MKNFKKFCKIFRQVKVILGLKNIYLTPDLCYYNYMQLI